jgi:hypothetical protein
MRVRVLLHGGRRAFRGFVEMRLVDAASAW